jgi:KDO transferase-3
MRLLTKARRKLKRLSTPPELKHMGKLHPDFGLVPSDHLPGAHQVTWKGKRIGIARPLSMLPAADQRDCYIIASGPSLADFDLSRLSGRICFWVNGSIVKATQCDLRVSYFVVTDKNFARDRFELVRQGIASGANCIFGFRVLNEIAEREPALLASERLFLIQEINARYAMAKLDPAAFDAWAEGEAGLFLHESGRLKRGWVGFSQAIDKGVFTGQTVVYSALQVACALGFRQVFILGMDLGGTGTLARFYESGSNVAGSRLDEDFEPYIVPSFELARRLTGKMGVEIYNVSPRSRLPDTTIRKIDFDEMLALTGR